MASYFRSKSTKLVAQRCHWHRCDMHSVGIYTAVTCTAESLTPLGHAQRSHWHHCDMYSEVIDTTVTCTAESLTPCTAESLTPLWHAQRSHWHHCDMHSGFIFEWLWLHWKGISIEKTYICKLTYTISITFTPKIWGWTKDRFCYIGIIDTAVTKIGDFVVDFLREFEAIFKKALTRVSGA
jgi:hypothetical protein